MSQDNKRPLKSYSEGFPVGYETPTKSNRTVFIKIIFLAVVIIVITLMMKACSERPSVHNISTTAQLNNVSVPDTKAAQATVPVGPSPEILKEFKNERVHVLKKMREALKLNYPFAAVALGERYAEVDDKEFQKLYREALQKQGVVREKMAAKIQVQDAMDDALASPRVRSFASVLCRSAVKEQLRSPSSADFPLLDGSLTAGPRLNTLNWNSYVDAQNAYGAEIRTKYICTLRFDGGDIEKLESWSVARLNIF
ncbi:MAG: hypothetical protein DI586_08615 [Micavibrio aeruginosavorus]|uniref:Uncharacterized protein n=1 Tax=Micavibrio aeruginosavorus TaxID=349221 RepID=A0A2W5FFW7_9BACT|nr:MAG: hypothetical protein DI586_08615 [Micavibrio aeruginosavorus]